MPIEKRTRARSTRTAVWAAAAAVVLLIPLQAAGLDLRFKLSGGYGLMPLDTVNKALSDWMKFKNLQAAAVSGWSVEQTGSLSLQWAYDFEGEILLKISSRMAIGIASGYVFGEISEDRFPLTWDKNGVITIEGRPTKIAMVPVTLSGYAYFPIGKNLQVYARGGFGRIHAKYADRETSKKPEDARYVYPTSQLAKGGGSCLVGGFGLTSVPASGVGFFFEVQGRKARAGGFEGENKDGVFGTLYVFDEYSASLDFWQTKIEIRETEPSGESFRSIRPVDIVLDGLSLKFGISVRF